jgi:mRNA interferase MazF
MRRGDVVVVAVSGGYGKPRPAVVIQSNGMPAQHPSVVICQMTSALHDAPDLRVTIEPSTENGLRERSQVMVDKPTTVRRGSISRTIGQLRPQEMARIDVLLAAILGLAD